jgi:hypothetical protein
VALPRGCLDDFTELLTGAGIEIKLRDERDEGLTVRTRFLGELTPEQDEAAAQRAFTGTALLSLRENRTIRFAGATHVVLEPLDFMYRMNGMPRAHDCREAGKEREQERKLCREDPPLITKIPGHVQWRQVSTGSAARAPPRGPPADSHQTLMLT